MKTPQRTVRKKLILKTRSIGKTQQTKRTIAEKYMHCVRFLSSYFTIIFDSARDFGVISCLGSECTEIQRSVPPRWFTTVPIIIE
jgi:hypothetical protein